MEYGQVSGRRWIIRQTKQEQKPTQAYRPIFENTDLMCPTKNYSPFFFFSQKPLCETPVSPFKVGVLLSK